MLGELVSRTIVKFKVSLLTLRSQPFGLAPVRSLLPIFTAGKGDPIFEHPATVEVPDRAGLPRILLIGDSISLGYTLPVRRALKGRANVHRPPVNCASTVKGLAGLEKWLGDLDWQVITFNFGLHDAIRDHQRPVIEPAAYAENLSLIVETLKSTGAKLIWVSTTPVPAVAAIPYDDIRYLNPTKEKLLEYRQEDIPAYNAIARQIMDRSGVEVLDLYAFTLPRMAELQVPGDIHFTSSGYRELAGQVVATIAAAVAGLSARTVQ